MITPRLYRSGSLAVTAVRLSQQNVHEVFEWVDGKYFFSPQGESPEREVQWLPRSGLAITGLSVFTPSGRKKADWGDWIVRLPRGRFIVVCAENFDAAYRLVQS